MSEPLARLAFNGASLEKLLTMSPEIAAGMISELLEQAIAMHGKALPQRITFALQLEEYDPVAEAEDGAQDARD